MFGKIDFTHSSIKYIVFPSEKLPMNLGSYKPLGLLNYFTKHVVFSCCHLVLKGAYL